MSTFWRSPRHSRNLTKCRTMRTSRWAPRNDTDEDARQEFRVLDEHQQRHRRLRQILSPLPGNCEEPYQSNPLLMANGGETVGSHTQHVFRWTDGGEDVPHHR
ncbi:toxin-antitoxin system, toxin component, RelE domain protein [Cooperia oncophora]